MPHTISVKCSQPISQTVKPYLLNNLNNFAFNELYMNLGNILEKIYIMTQ